MATEKDVRPGTADTVRKPL